MIMNCITIWTTVIVSCF